MNLEEKSIIMDLIDIRIEGSPISKLFFKNYKFSIEKESAKPFDDLCYVLDRCLQEEYGSVLKHG